MTSFTRRATVLSLRALTAVLFVAALPQPSFAEEPLFKLEENFKATVGSTGMLPAGTRLTFVASDFKQNEVFMVQRCGDPCNTAKMIRTWAKPDFDASATATVLLTEAGIYYFWIMRKLENGEVGPVFGSSASFEGNKGFVKFSSGTSFFVAVEVPSAQR